MRQGLEILLEQEMEVALCVLNLNGIVTVVLCGPRNMPPVQSHNLTRAPGMSLCSSETKGSCRKA